MVCSGMKDTITIIGAGAVGISSAIHLQQRGWQVTLVDRREPASETSWGNAGVINPASFVPLNNPDLHSSLGRYLRNDTASLRFKKAHLLRNLPWLLAFLQASKTRPARHNSRALHSLTSQALDEHRALMQRTGNAHRLTESGWLKVFRHGGPERAAKSLDSFSGRLMREMGIDIRVLSREELQEKEPALRPIFDSAYQLMVGGVVDNPGLMLREHAMQFVADGGTLVQGEVSDITESESGVSISLNGNPHQSDRVLIAAGPWSADVLAFARYRVTLAVERGYHAHYALAGGPTPVHSVHDIDGEYIVGPMTGGLRLTTGVELAPRDDSSNLSQLEQVEPRLFEAFDIAGRTDEPVWRGARPTLPDGVPVIGALPRSERLWVNFGHQHIGMMTGPVSGKLVAQQLSGETPDTDMTPFRPSRWIHKLRASREGSWFGQRLGG